VAEIVHEMRTPLVSVMGYAELMRQPGATLEQCIKFSEIIQCEAERLNGMASNFLDLARLESGRAPIAQDSVDMSTIIRMAVSVLTPRADAKQVGMTLDIPESLPSVLGDGQRLHQALLNLVGNAVKYCRRGDNVKVAVRVEDGFLEVSVADTGPGIPADALPRIFERFYRVPGAEAKAVGTGLGLTITKQIVEAHGGKIGVSSVEGEGATFTFALPIASSSGNRS